MLCKWRKQLPPHPYHHIHLYVSIYLYSYEHLCEHLYEHLHEQLFEHLYEHLFEHSNDGGAERRLRNVAGLVFTNTFTNRVTVVVLKVFL